MTIFLHGVAAQFYRGIGAETQYIAPFSRLNFFVGPNNSGKSIVLNLISGPIAHFQGVNKSFQLSGEEVHFGKESGSFKVAIGSPIDQITKNFSSKVEISILQQIKLICEKMSVHGMVWSRYAEDRKKVVFPEIDFEIARSWQQNWNRVWQVLTNRSGGGVEHWVNESLLRIAQEVQSITSLIHLIPAKREIGIAGEKFDDLTGKGLIDHLAELQAPNFDKQIDRERFKRINSFLQEVTGKSGAILEVPHNRQHILVHIDDKVLPLSSLGTGIHEVVLIAAFCTIHDGSIMCIEEPEIHLHPLLQKKLIRYLLKNTSSQYFIATHSAAFIDTADASVFSVSNDGQQTRIQYVNTKGQGRDLLNAMGYLASDILQSNMIIWVEGPSDRIYLNHWINAVDENLSEGIHYTIMFYGGALISHLAASDEALEKFIRLQDMNRNFAIVLDSDKDSENAPLKVHAGRIQEEVPKDRGIVWITAGREIENYVDWDDMQSALQQVHPNLYRKASRRGDFEHAFHFYRDNPDNAGSHKIYSTADKVGVATVICDKPANLDVLDLKARVTEIVDIIRTANGIAG